MKKVFLVLLLPFFVLLSACTQNPNQSYDINEFLYGLSENERAESSIRFEIEIIIPDNDSKKIDTLSIKPIVGSWVEDKVKDVNIKDVKNTVNEDDNLLEIKGEVTFDNEGLSNDKLEELNKKEPAFLGVSFINEDEKKYDITFQENEVSVKEIE
ncbi:hypothetical protein [Cytobacillus horneckiae]|uniref:Lipoprotein n=1 Tax=Cytobacillus horneckiae TaxID=549687 RepID=A0A2N0ZMP9_9BACI|nr:hypothetical protein [Cytobacillus horneckiae]MEC1159103.1 hypothetical protein [Cytobacillus horneckiae]MED2938795.1 hypothetical protein [Cytobacillus horneckiae]PKG30790.1 hypothetical protein CWS20_01550 [Cytobacillus horneckiae]